MILDIGSSKESLQDILAQSLPGISRYSVLLDFPMEGMSLQGEDQQYEHNPTLR